MGDSQLPVHWLPREISLCHGHLGNASGYEKRVTLASYKFPGGSESSQG